MEKIIMTEEQALDLLKHIPAIPKGMEPHYASRLKDEGYIKQTPLEIAKKEYINFLKDYAYIAVSKFSSNYISELELEIERLKELESTREDRR